MKENERHLSMKSQKNEKVQGLKKKEMDFMVVLVSQKVKVFL